MAPCRALHRVDPDAVGLERSAARTDTARARWAVGPDTNSATPRRTNAPCGPHRVAQSNDGRNPRGGSCTGTTASMSCSGRGDPGRMDPGRIRAGSSRCWTGSSRRSDAVLRRRVQLHALPPPPRSRARTRHPAFAAGGPPAASRASASTCGGGRRRQPAEPDGGARRRREERVAVFVALSLFRRAAILAGVRHRAAMGNASAPDAARRGPSCRRSRTARWWWPASASPEACRRAARDDVFESRKVVVVPGADRARAGALGEAAGLLVKLRAFMARHAFPPGGARRHAASETLDLRLARRQGTGPGNAGVMEPVAPARLRGPVETRRRRRGRHHSYERDVLGRIAR